MEMLTQLGLQADRQREESQNFAPPSGDKAVPESGYKIELKPEVPALQPASLFPPFGMAPPNEQKPPEAFKPEPAADVDYSDDTKELIPQAYETKESPVKYEPRVNYVSLDKVETPVNFEPQDSSVEQSVCEQLPATPHSDFAEEKDEKDHESSSEMDTSFDEYPGASFDPHFGSEPVNRNEIYPGASSRSIDVVQIATGSIMDTGMDMGKYDKVLDDDSSRSQCKKEPPLEAHVCDSEASTPFQQEEDNKREEVESSTSERGIQIQCSPEGSDMKHPNSNSGDSTVTSHSDTSEAFAVKEPCSNSENTVSSHTDSQSNVLIPLASSSSTMPSQSDAQEASGVNGNDSDHHNEGDDVGNQQSEGDLQDQRPMSSHTGLPKTREGEVSSLVDAEPLMSRDGNNELASLESVTIGDSADSSNKETESREVRPPAPEEQYQHHQLKQRRNSVVETLVSCSSDAPLCTVTQEAEASTSTVGCGVTAEDYELEEGECISDTEEEEEEGVTSMEASVGSKPHSLGAEVSSSKEDRMEEDMEVDLPDQSSDGEPSHSNQCHVVSTWKQEQSKCGTLPDTATHRHSCGGESSSQQEPHSATMTENPPHSRQNDEAIDSTSGVVEADMPAPSHSKLSEASGTVVGDVSSSSTTPTPHILCESTRGNELLIVDNKGEEPSPSTSNMGNDLYFSSRDNSVSPSEVEASVNTQTCNSQFLQGRLVERTGNVFDSPVTSVSANGSISSSSSSPVPILASSAKALHLHSSSSSASPSSSRMSTSPSISPTGIAPSSSTSAIPTLQPTPTKKRVSTIQRPSKLFQLAQFKAGNIFDSAV